MSTNDGENSEIGAREQLIERNAQMTEEIQALTQTYANMYHDMMDGLTSLSRPPGASAFNQEAPPPTREHHIPSPTNIPTFTVPVGPALQRSSSDSQLRARNCQYDRLHEPIFGHANSPDHRYYPEPQVDRHGKKQDNEVLQRMKTLEKALKRFQGNGDHSNVSFKELCLFSHVPLPKGFSIPKFDLYKGRGDPRVHLKTYCNKMRGAGRDELLISLFIESLGGTAAEWFLRQDTSKWKKWDELAKDFLHHFNFNIEIEPDRTSLEAIKKKPNESFGEYALRWREQAARVNPPLHDLDIVKTFIDAQECTFYSAMISSLNKPFSEVVKLGEMVEKGIKAGKIVSLSAFKATSELVQSEVANSQQKSERCDEIAMVEGNLKNWNDRRYHQPQSYPRPPQAYPHQQHYSPQNQYFPFQYPTPAPTTYAPTFSFQQRQASTPQSVKYAQQAFRKHYQAPKEPPCWPKGPLDYLPKTAHKKQEKNQKKGFTPIGRSYTSLFEELQILEMLSPIRGGMHQRDRIDDSQQCAYHSGASGHDTENCYYLKKAIQCLIDDKQIQVDMLGELKINQNTQLGNNDTSMVGMVEEFNGEAVKPIISIQAISSKEPGSVTNETEQKERLRCLEQFVVDMHYAFTMGQDLPPLPISLTGIVPTRARCTKNPCGTIKDPPYSPNFPQYDRVTYNARTSVGSHRSWNDGRDNQTQSYSRTLRSHVQDQPNSSYRAGGTSGFRPSAYHKKARVDKKASYTPIGESYSSVFEKLRSLDLLKPVCLNAHPKVKVDHSRRCAYHSGAPGHDTEECHELKWKIQALINDGRIRVEMPVAPADNKKPTMVKLVKGFESRDEAFEQIVYMGTEPSREKKQCYRM